MNDLTGHVTAVRGRAHAYRGCSHDQALVYAVEDEVDDALGVRELSPSQVREVVATVCEVEDVDEPRLRFDSRGAVVGSADLVDRVVRIRAGGIALSTVVHEIAHVTSGAENHGREFRDELVRLTRAHVSVAHAAMLRTLLEAVGLDVGSGHGRSRVRREVVPANDARAHVARCARDAL